ncbi:primase-helicase family protein, partial [Paenirhodobacter populi]|uniref:primase-helicase family protein n=1 Tax=Paenirhodobacter populi TaxID=2306993 RepID=UPI0013E3BDA0
DAKKFAAQDSNFNAWAERNLMLHVKEAGTQNSLALNNKLLDLISDDKIPIEGKGKDQKTGKNYLNVIIDSNYKSSVAIKKTGRRYAVFYMPFETENDLLRAGLTNEYFSNLKYWLDYQDGYAIVADWLHNYQIKCGSLPVRAPRTSYFEEATRESLNGAAAMLMAAIEAEEDGFKNGYIVALHARRYLQNNGYSKLNDRTVADAIKQLPINYYKIQRNDGGKNQIRVGGTLTAVYSTSLAATFEDFNAASGATPLQAPGLPPQPLHVPGAMHPR